MPTAPESSAETGLTDLVRRWVAAWAQARASMWSPVRGGWQIEVVGSPYRSRETVLVEPDDATYAHWAESLTGPAGWWLTVITAASRTYPRPPWPSTRQCCGPRQTLAS